MFPGQGAQYVGMGKSLYESSAHSRAVFEEVNASLGESLSTLMFTGPLDRLCRTSNAQPALLAHSIATLHAWVGSGQHITPPTWVLGHSVGEYAALVACGSLTLWDAARVLRQRGVAMQAAGDASSSICAMQALLFTHPTSLGDLEGVVGEACKVASQAGKGVVSVAAINSPSQAVISGHALAVEHAVAILRGLSGGTKDGSIPTPSPRFRRAVPLPVSAPFHSPIMAPTERILRESLDYCISPITAPRVQFVAGVNAQPVTTVLGVKEALIQGVVSPVRWGACVERVISEAGGVEGVHFIEFGGPVGGTLTPLVSQVVKGAVATPLATHDGIVSGLQERPLQRGE